MRNLTKLVSNFQKNKARIKQTLAIFFLGSLIRYCNIDPRFSNLRSNSTQHIKHERNLTVSEEEHTEKSLNDTSSSRLIKTKTGSNALIKISADSKYALKLRAGGDLGKNGPGPKAKADALKNTKAGIFSSLGFFPTADAFTPKQRPY